MSKTDQKQSRPKFKAAILIASDRAHSGERPDRTGPALEKRLAELGYTVVFCEVVPDDGRKIESTLKTWISDEKINLILISGGTGLSPSDVTPEATLSIIEKRVPGMEEAMRQASSKITPFGMLSRCVVGTTEESLIINLPGSPKGALENLNIIEPALEHALELICGGHPDP
jgi:molybdenum cofactor synthesis domain-containing protein